MWGCGLRLTTQLLLVSRLRISAAIPPLLHVLSWRAQGQIYLYFFNIILPFTLWSVLLSLICLREHNEELPTA